MPPKKKDTKGKLYYKFYVYPLGIKPKLPYLFTVEQGKKVPAKVKKLKIKGIKITDAISYGSSVYISVDSKLKDIPTVIEEYTKENPILEDKIKFGYKISERNNFPNTKATLYSFYLYPGQIEGGPLTKAEVDEEIEHSKIENEGQQESIDEEIERFRIYVEKFNFTSLTPHFDISSNGITVEALVEKKNTSNTRSPPKSRVSPTKKQPNRKTPIKRRR